MRHIVRLGVRGVLLDFGAVLLRVLGAIHYRRLLRHRRKQQVVASRRPGGMMLNS